MSDTTETVVPVATEGLPAVVPVDDAPIVVDAPVVVDPEPLSPEEVVPEYQRYIRIPDVIEAKIAETDGTAHGHDGSIDYKAGDALVRYTLPDEKSTAAGIVYYDREWFTVIPAEEFAHYALLGEDGGLVAEVTAWDTERTALQAQVDELTAAKKVADDRVVALDWQVTELRKQLKEANSKLVALGQ